MRLGTGTTAAPGPLIWAAVPRGRRMTAVALLAMLAARAAASAGGGHGERGDASGGTAAAEDRAGAPGPRRERVCAALPQGPPPLAHPTHPAAVPPRPPRRPP